MIFFIFCLRPHFFALSTFFIIGRCCTRSQALNERLLLTFCFPLKIKHFFYEQVLTDSKWTDTTAHVQMPYFRCTSYYTKTKAHIDKKEKKSFFSSDCIYSRPDDYSWDRRQQNTKTSWNENDLRTDKQPFLPFTEVAYPQGAITYATSVLNSLPMVSILSL